jgi:hypothetical protein
MIGPQTQYSKIGGPIVGIYIYIAHRYMNAEIGKKATLFRLSYHTAIFKPTIFLEPVFQPAKISL